MIALVMADPLRAALVTFALCVSVVLLALWAFEEYHALMDRFYARASMPIPLLDVAPMAREQWPRDALTVRPRAEEQHTTEGLTNATL